MPTMNRPSRAFGYLRVSTDQQADSGLGLEAQRAAVEGAAQRLGLALVDVFTWFRRTVRRLGLALNRITRREAPKIPAK